ncbi:MAG: GTP 3',8-cyclase MoaA [Nitrospirota bacterium]|jgi:cyclic pyranopterin phosphate synthase
MARRPGVITDPFERRIDYLRVSVTDRCNLSCVYCSPEKKRRFIPRRELLTPGEIARFAGVALRHGLRKVRITGGEPLLRGDLREIISSIKALGVRDVSLTTNGVLLEEMAPALRRAGLDRVNVSLDTLSPSRYAEITGGGDIRRVWRGVEAAEAQGLSPVKINVVPIRGINDDEVTDFAALTMERDIHIRFIEYMPVGRSSICLKGKCVTKAELMEKVSRLGRLRKLPFRGAGPSRNYRLEGARGVLGFISPVSEHFCDHCNRLRLTAAGRVRPCLLSAVEIDIKTALRRGAKDEELEALFLRAVGVKPRGHRLAEGEPLPDLPSMSEIGG